MNISELSIRRPVLATVMTVIILLFGMIGYFYIGVREYPSVDNPIISVSCSYAGANADVIENQITEPLEQNINGIPGIRSLTSAKAASRLSSNFRSTWKLRPTMSATKFPAPNATCHVTATLLPYPRPMPMPLLFLWSPCKVKSVLCSN